jgi:hypothetical protein
MKMETTMNKQTSKLPEGWHFTEKHGYVFVSPGGSAWVVERQGNKLESVSGSLTKDDLMGKTAIEKRQVSIRNQGRRPLRHQQ